MPRQALQDLICCRQYRAPAGSAAGTAKPDDVDAPPAPASAALL
jgi:hypothetical protein